MLVRAIDTQLIFVEIQHHLDCATRQDSLPRVLTRLVLIQPEVFNELAKGPAGLVGTKEHRNLSMSETSLQS